MHVPTGRHGRSAPWTPASSTVAALLDRCAMRIRNQLVALVSGVLLPLTLLAAFVTWQLWTQQRQAYQQQYQERASAVRLAIDTEFDVTLRTLRATGDATEIPPAESEVVLRRRFRRLLDNYPDWVTVSLTDAAGRVTMTNSRPGRDAAPPLAQASIARAMASPAGLISDVTVTKAGARLVYVAASIMRGDATQGVIVVAIEHAHWLDLLRAYPVSKSGTLTLIDRNATVIARTVNDARWAGTKVPPAYWAKTIDRDSGAFKTLGVDGNTYYAAFSRSNSTGWILTAGVPESEVDDALRWKTLAVLLVAAGAILGALLAAWLLGKRISDSMLGLLQSARALTGKEPLKRVVLKNREARMVRTALFHEHAQLLARDAALGASLEREAAARARAERANSAKDQFLAMMGHELRNPLSAITAAMDLLSLDDVPRQALSRSREIVRRQAGHLAVMINDLMDVAQLGSGDIVLNTVGLDLAKVATKVLQRFDETGRCAHLQMHTAHVPAWIDGDEARIELLMTCLLDNACKYTPAGGTVLLEVLGEDDASVLKIRDTGAGLAADIVGNMFDAFTQGKRGIERTEGGLGLGLALVRELVNLHGGTIAADSQGVGHGATFTVRFPRIAAPLPQEPPARRGPADRLLVTIVEDIADNREALTMLLQARGFDAHAAADGPEGVELILRGPSDVALVDIGLPGFDGFEVARRVRQSASGQGVLLVALTGYGTDDDRTRALAAGFDEFLVKPFDPGLFEQALDAGLAANARSRR